MEWYFPGLADYAAVSLGGEMAYKSDEQSLARLVERL